MKQKTLFFCVVLSYVLCIYKAFAQPSFLLHLGFNERAKAIDSLHKEVFRYNDSATVFRTLDQWIAWADAEDDKELAAEFEFLRMKYYSDGVQQNFTMFERSMPPFISGMKEENLRYIKLKAIWILAHHYFYQVQDFNTAFDIYFQLYKQLQEVSMDEFPPKQHYLYDYGLTFYFFDDHENARKYFMEISEEENRDFMWLNFQAYNTLGLSYRKTCDYDSSTYYFEKARQIGIRKKDSMEISIALGNIGHNYFLLKQFDKAVPLLELDMNYSSTHNEYANAAAAALSLAQINVSKKRLAEAEQQCLNALHWLAKSYRVEEYLYYSNAYQLLSEIYASKKNMGLAYAYADSAAVAKDSLHTRMSAHFLSTAQRKIEAEKHASELKEFEGKRHTQVLYRNGLIIILFLLMVISLLFFSRKRLKYKQEQLVMEAQQQLMGEELSAAAERLNAFTKNIIEKNDLIEQLQHELDVISDDALAKLNRHTILTNDDWEEFRLLFEKVHHGYFERLKEKLPDLSPAEVRFMTLAKLNFSSRQMADTLGIGTDAVRMMRHRLRKKLNLTEEGGLEELIANI